MFWFKKPKIDYYVCTISKTFAKSGQCMYFQVEYTKDKLQEYIQEDDKTLPLKNVDDTVSGDARFMLGTDKRATVTTNWSLFAIMPTFARLTCALFTSSARTGTTFLSWSTVSRRNAVIPFHCL